MPVKLKTLKIKHRYFYYFILTFNDQILIKRRDNTDIWAGLHDFPLIERENETNIDDILKQTELDDWFQTKFTVKSVSPQIKHILTHQRLFAQFIHIEVKQPSSVQIEPTFWINKSDISNYGLPKLIFEFMNKFLN